tara:strand:+ start:6344 stop:6532 length:189 start_codon:yes stop_codon:yes gene_type:complete
MRKSLNKIMPSQQMGITEMAKMAKEHKKMKKIEMISDGIEMAKMKQEMPSILDQMFGKKTKK